MSEQAQRNCADPTNPACAANAATRRRDGLPHPERHPELLDVRARLRAAGPHVRAERVVEPARAPVPGVGVVGDLHQARRSRAVASTRSCRRPSPPNGEPDASVRADTDAPIYAWTDLTYLLHKHNVSWGYYVVAGTEPDCAERRRARAARRSRRTRKTPGIWNPLPYFDTVRNDGQLGNIQSVDELLHRRAERARCPRSRGSSRPATVSEHPPARGQRRRRVRHQPRQRGHDAAPTGTRPRSSWRGTTGAASTTTSSRPPSTQNGYGLRVPGIVISPYAKHGYIDHQTLSFDAYVKFIEDDFLGGQRLDPQTDGRPDPRPDVRENVDDPRRPHQRLRLHPGAPDRHSSCRHTPTPR